MDVLSHLDPFFLLFCLFVLLFILLIVLSAVWLLLCVELIVRVILHLGELEQGRADFLLARQVLTRIRNGWMVEWCNLLIAGPDQQMVERLTEIGGTDSPRLSWGCILVRRALLRMR